MTICLMLDVDGVLVKGRPKDGQFWTHELQKDLGIDPDCLVQDFFMKEWQDVVTGRLDLRSSLSLSLKRLGTNVTCEDLISYWFEMDSRIVQSVLADCRVARELGIQIFLATNQEHLRAAYLMDEMGLRAEVDGIVYSGEVGFQKPKAEFFDFAIGVTGLEPHDLLLVDDTQTNVEGARKAGWQAVLWDGSEQLSDILDRYGGS